MIFPLLAVMLLCPRWSVSTSDHEQGSDHEPELYKRLYDFGLGKRAAYYVSEYKRLPVYNFGLGKRDANRNMYSFGLGKRDYYDNEEDVDDELMDSYSKRMKPYGFGLGKRLSPSPYSFGLGKRRDGKMYSFGLGKRNYGDYDTDSYLNSLDETAAKEKKSPKGHRFSFGLGKREVNKDLMDLIGNDDIAEFNPERTERSMHYNFGLGKRDSEEVIPEHPPSQGSQLQFRR